MAPCTTDDGALMAETIRSGLSDVAVTWKVTAAKLLFGLLSPAWFQLSAATHSVWEPTVRKEVSKVPFSPCYGPGWQLIDQVEAQVVIGVRLLVDIVRGVAEGRRHACGDVLDRVGEVEIVALHHRQPGR